MSKFTPEFVEYKGLCLTRKQEQTNFYATYFGDTIEKGILPKQYDDNPSFMPCPVIGETFKFNSNTGKYGCCNDFQKSFDFCFTIYVDDAGNKYSVSMINGRWSYICRIYEA